MRADGAATLAALACRAAAGRTSHSASLGLAAARAFSTSIAKSAARDTRDPGRLLRDEAIRARVVRLVDPDTGSLMPAVYPMKDLLANIDRRRFWVTQVKAQTMSRAREGNGQQDEQEEEEQEEKGEMRQPTLEEMAIVKLVDKREAYNRQKTIKRGPEGSAAASTSGGQSGIGAGVSGEAARKEVQLTWASTSYDMEHKLASLKSSHLMRKGPGAQVQVIISTPSKGKTRPNQAVTPEAKREFCQTIENFLCDWHVTQDGQQQALSEEGAPAQETDGGTAADSAKAQPAEEASGAAATSKPVEKVRGYRAERLGEIEWRGGKRMPVAVVKVRVVRT